MKAFFKTHFSFFAIISLLALILFFNLSKSSYVFGGAEEGIPFYNIKRTIEVYSNIWVDQIPGFPLTFEVGKIPFLNLLLLIENVANSQVIVSSFFISFIFLGSAISMYLLCYELIQKGAKNKGLIASIAAMFYVLNPFSISQVWGRHLSMQLYPLLLAPLMLLLVVAGLKSKSYKFAIFASFASAVFAGAYNHPSYAISIVLTCALVLVIYALKQRNKLNFVIKFSGIFALTFLLFNSFWILPYYSQVKIPSDFATKSENREIIVGLSKFFPLSSIATLQQKFYFEQVEPFKTQYSEFNSKLIGLAVPLITFMGLLGIRNIRKNFRLSLVVLFFTSFFFAAGANRPFGPIVLFIMDNFPIMDLYRNTFEKTGIFLTIGYSIFFAFGVMIIANKVNRFKGMFLSIFFIGYFIAYMAPFWDLRVFTSKDTDNSPPKYIDEFSEWAALNADSRFMFLPILDGDSTRNLWDSGYYNGIDITPFIADKSITRHLPQLGEENYFSRQFAKRVFSSNVGNLLDMMGVKYIIVREDLETSAINKSQIDRVTSQTIVPSKNRLIVCNKTTTIDSNLFKDCEVKENTLNQFEFLEVKVQANIPVNMEFRILNSEGFRSRWDGKSDNTYTAKAGLNTFILPFGTESELPGSFDYSTAKAIEVGYTKINPSDSTDVKLESASLIKGEKVNVSNLVKLNEFGNYKLYQRNGFEPQNLTSIRNIIQVPEESEIFNKSYDPKIAFVTKLNDMNFTDNDITRSHEKQGMYRVTTESNGPIAIRLNTFYNNGWVVSATDSDNPFTLLSSKVAKPEHLKADGFANLWVLNGSTNYTFYYEPALYFKIGTFISAFSLLATTIILILRRTPKKRLV